MAGREGASLVCYGEVTAQGYEQWVVSGREEGHRRLPDGRARALNGPLVGSKEHSKKKGGGESRHMKKKELLLNTPGARTGEKGKGLRRRGTGCCLKKGYVGKRAYKFCYSTAFCTSVGRSLTQL